VVLEDKINPLFLPDFHWP